MIIFKNKLLFIISLIITIGVIIGFSITIMDDFFPDSAIQKRGEIYSESFVKVAQNVEEDLISLKNILDTTAFFDYSIDDQIKFLMHHLQGNNELQGIMVITHSGRFSTLLRDKKTFIYTTDSASNIDNVTWYRVNTELKLLNTWDMVLGYRFNFFSEKEAILLQSPQFEQAQWNSTNNLFGSSQIDLASHITWKTKDDEILSCVVTLCEENIGGHKRFFGQNDYQSFFINIENQCIPLHIIDLISVDTTKAPDALYMMAKNSWEVTGKKIPSTYSFNYKNEFWWGQAISIPIDGIKGVVLNASQKSLYYSSITDHVIELVLIILFIVINVILYLRTKSGAHLSLEDFIKSQGHDKHAIELVKEGESSHLEFKSSFHFDYHLKTVNKDLESVIAKSIAAFSNAKGGTLLIGIDDDGNVLGLENDINTLKRKDIDFFENTIRMYLNNTFSVSFITQNVHIKFPVIEQKAICRIDITASHEPVFVVIVKNSRKSERFYLRSGNTSQEITSLSEINDYVKDRF